MDLKLEPITNSISLQKKDSQNNFANLSAFCESPVIITKRYDTFVRF